MGNSNKFWKGVLLGALAGGALSLLDRATRQSVAEDCRKVTGTVSHYAKNPNELVDQVKDTTVKLRTAFEQVSEDVAFITEKVEELKESTPQVTGMVKDTKAAFKKIGQPNAEKDSKEEGSEVEEEILG